MTAYKCKHLDFCDDGCQQRVAELEARLTWLLGQCSGGWYLNNVHNTYTGFFINRMRSQGFRNGEEEWESERIAWAPIDESFNSAVDRAIAGEDPDEQMIAGYRARKAARAKEPTDG